MDFFDEPLERIVGSSPEIPVPDWHIDEVSRRKQEYENDPSIAVSWTEAKQRILNTHER
ncbi:MAG: hypothetical protein JWM11_3771 [Planctomycetaceae bacterium]|nr:hypothetical protein [Planctomycetaceae bacterium]